MSHQTNQSAQSPKSKAVKPVAPVASLLKKAWLFWLVARVLIYPVSVILMTSATWSSLANGVGLSLFMMLPALVATYWVLSAKSAYALIVISLMSLVYLAVAAGMMAVRWYESANLLWVFFGLETALLLVINAALFILLRRLPPMHKA